MPRDRQVEVSRQVARMLWMCCVGCVEHVDRVQSLSVECGVSRVLQGCWESELETVMASVQRASHGFANIGYVGVYCRDRSRLSTSR